jgi:FG-GAP-like repeat
MRRTLLLLLLAGAAAAQTPGFTSSVSEVQGGSTRIALRDFDGDGRKDLLLVDVEGLALRRLRPDGTFPDADDSRLAWPSATTGWTLADLDGDGRQELLLLADGRKVLSVKPDAQGQLAATLLVEEPQGFLPRGIRRVNFVRDVDGDGHADLVLPGNGRFLIRRNLGAQGFATAIAVACRSDIGMELGDPSRLDARFGENVIVPWFTLQDLDGDGRTDLVSETAQAVQAHLARPDLPMQPTWSLDLAALRADLPPKGPVDLDNLLGNIEPQINWRAGDLDGQAPNDLVLQVGGTFKVYLGGGAGPKLDQPDQVLKASGNVLYFLLNDVNGDGRPDLQILRAATVSLADALRMLIVPGSIDFDVFTYLDVRGTPGADPADVFARRPTTRTTVSLHVPALIHFLSDLDDLKADYDKRRAVPAQAACLDGDGAVNDVVDLRGDGVAIWKDAVPKDFKPGFIEQLRSFDVDDLLQQYVLAELDRMGDGGRLDISLEDIKGMLVTPGYDLREAVKDRKPDKWLPLTIPVAGAKIRIEDLDGDGRGDIIVSVRPTDGPRQVQFLVGGPP